MRVVLTGASGQLGSYVADVLTASGHELVPWSGTETGVRGGATLRPVDVTDPEAVTRALESARPDAILHAAGMASADAVWRDPERGRRVNTEATARLAEWCARNDRRIVYVSTDLVFGGTKAWNREDDPAEPILAYGRSKLDAEPAVVAAPRGLAARVSLLYGRSRARNESYFDRTMGALRRGEPQSFFEDEFRTPLDLATAATILVRLVESELTGILHVGAPERVSRYELMRRVAVAQGINPALVRANRRADVTFNEPRPSDMSLDTSRLAASLPGIHRPTIEEAAIAHLPNQ